jgi:hypothetical protein
MTSISPLKITPTRLLAAGRGAMEVTVVAFTAMDRA